MELNEICPADIIILDTSAIEEKQAICYVDTSIINGKTGNTKKNASSLTQSIVK